MREIHDKYFKKAKREGRLARSFYKLEELDRRAKLIKAGNRIIDLGACPGSWLEYILEKVGGNGKVCAVDLNVINKKFKGKVEFKKIDIRDVTPDMFGVKNFDVVVSDMAPKTSGIKLVDQARSLELCEIAAKFAIETLVKGGNFVCKIFESPEVQPFRESLRDKFAAIRMIKPDACRDESLEVYVVCTGFGLEPEDKRARPDHELRKTKGKRTRQY